MADPRVKYIQDRVDQSLVGWDFTPPVETLLASARGKQILDDFFKPDGPPKLLLFCQVRRRFPSPPEHPGSRVCGVTKI